MTTTTRGVIAGVDTHKFTHHTAVLDLNGQLLADKQFSADDPGHRALSRWLGQFGEVQAIGVEGTSSYGTALTRVLIGDGRKVIEVNRPSRTARRADGKSDQLDAEQAARAVLASTATAVPKSKSGSVEVIRMLRIARSTAVKSRTQAFNALHAVAVVAPQPLRDELVKLSGRALVNRCVRLRPDTTPLLELIAEPERLLVAGAKTALRDLADRCKTLDTEIKALSKQITALVTATAPALVELMGVGAEIAGQLLMTAGDNPERLRSEGAFAKLCGVAPQPASSGKTSGRHRLSRGGDRAANSALYMIAITRMRHHGPTRDYVERRTAEGLSKREILRCLKRYIAREIYTALPIRPSSAPAAAPA
jgi:transposase